MESLWDKSLFKIIIYYIICGVFKLITKIFFREVVKRGSHQIPSTGSVIFVAAPHVNQFVDPLVIMHTCPRPLRFLMAASSMRKGIPGFFGRLFGCIPVERAMDLAKAGTGRISLDPKDPLKIIGQGTRFLKEVESHKEMLAVIVGPETYTAPVESVKSDTELKLSRSFDDKVIELLLLKSKAEQKDGNDFQIFPVIDQTEVYSSVFKVLKHGECLGIFPEGGSHDRAEMLPLKAGVTIMALGAMARDPQLEMTIIPCGLNYFNPHKFRSRAIIEYGEPIRVDRSLVELFKMGGDERREACGRLLDQVYYSLCSVTINVPDYEALQLMQATRRLYEPQSEKLCTFELLEVTRRFTKGYLAFKDQPRVKRLLNGILEYNKLLKSLQLYDHQVRTFNVSRSRSILLLVSQLLKLIIYAIFSLPGIILNLPAMLIINYISKRKAEKAVATSNVKIQGRDVLATWKVMVGFFLFPLLYLIYCTPLATYFWDIVGKSLKRLALFYFVVMILLYISSYVTVLIVESGYQDTYLSIRPLWYSATHPHYAMVVRNLRHRLKIEIIKAVDEYGPKLMSDFAHSRIVPSRRKSMSHQDWEQAGVAKNTKHTSMPIIEQEEEEEKAEEEDDDDEIAKIVEKAQTISRESSPILTFDRMDSVIAGFNYMRSGVQSALRGSNLGPLDKSETLRRADWSYVDPVEIDDIFFTSDDMRGEGEGMIAESRKTK